jgi:hypothetical protein
VRFDKSDGVPLRSALRIAELFTLRAFHIGRGKPERKDLVQAVAILNYKAKVITGSLDQFVLPRRHSSVEERLRLINYAVSFRQYPAENFG